MSKINQTIIEYAHKQCDLLRINKADLKYAGLNLEQALELGYLTADIVFQMQHLASIFKSFVNEYVVINEGRDEMEIYSVYEKDMATDEQIGILNSYYKTHHNRFSEADNTLTTFLLYASVRSALFNRNDINQRRLGYAKMLTSLDEGIVIVDHVTATMRNLRLPNKMLHVELGHSIPEEVNMNYETPTIE